MTSSLSRSTRNRSPVRVEEADVAGGPPAVVVGALGAVGPVAAEQVRAPDLDLARVLALGRLAGLVDQPDLDARQRRTDRAGLERLAAQGAGHDRRGLREPVALVDRQPGQLAELRPQLGRERRRAGQDQPHRAEPLLEPVDVTPVGEDGRSDRDHAAGLVLDQVEGALRLEAAGEHQLGPVPHHDAEHRVEAVDVEQRQHTEHHVVAVDHRRLDAGDLLDVGQQRPVA